MLVLGIETATPVAAVAVVAADRVLAERVVNNKKTHSVNLLPMIKTALEDAGASLQDLSGIAVSSGPGSFTGLRIGMSTAKTLAHVLDLPVVGVSTLEALAYRYAPARELVCPVLNARKNEVYAGIFRAGEYLWGPAALGIDSLAGVLREYFEDVLFLGDGILIYRDQLQEKLGSRVKFAPVSNIFPGGGEIACLGLERIKRGECQSPFQLLPQYVRLSEAEVKWQQKQAGCPG